MSQKKRKKLLAIRFIDKLHAKRVNVGGIMLFVLTEGFGLILYEIHLWNCCTMFWNAISFNNTFLVVLCIICVNLKKKNVT